MGTSSIFIEIFLKKTCFRKYSEHWIIFIKWLNVILDVEFCDLPYFKYLEIKKLQKAMMLT